jgi:hypothetical protein
MYAKKNQDPLPELGKYYAYMIATITIAQKNHPKPPVLSCNLDIPKTEACMISLILFHF